VRKGVCNAGRPWYVDWVFGSRKVAFSGYVEDRSRLDRRITDHPVIVSVASLDPERFPFATTPVPAAPGDPGTTTDPGMTGSTTDTTDAGTVG
jgi:hypothetical protein